MAKIYGVTTATTESNDKRIGIIKENSDGNFVYSTDGLTYKTASGGTSGGSKGYDYVIAPSNSNMTSADLVLTGTDDQIEINKFLTKTVSKVIGYVPTIKFLGGTVKLTGTVTIPCNVNFISDGNTTIGYFANYSENYMFVANNLNSITFRGFTMNNGTSGSQGCRMVSMSNIDTRCVFSDCKLDLVVLQKDSPLIFFDNNAQSVLIDNCEINFTGGNTSTTSVMIKSAPTTGGIVRNSKIGDRVSIRKYSMVVPNFSISDCTLDGFVDLLGYSEVDYDSDASINPSLKSVKNCQFNLINDLLSIVSDRRITIHTPDIDGCTFNTPLDLYQYQSRGSFIAVDTISNCNFVESSIIRSSNLINNCNFNVRGISNSSTTKIFGTLIQNCYIGNSCEIEATNLIGCIFNEIYLQISNVVNIFNCEFHDIMPSESVTENVGISAEIIQNCLFENSGLTEDKICNLLANKVINCTFKDILIPSNSTHEEFFISINDISGEVRYTEMRGCTFDNVSLQSVENANATILIDGFNSVKNCKFLNITNDKNLIFIGGSSHVSDILVEPETIDDTAVGSSYTFYKFDGRNSVEVDLEQQQDIFFENVKILNSKVKEFFTDDPVTTDYYITLNNIVMASKEPHFKIPTSRKFIVDGLTINKISTESYTSLFEAPNQLSIFGDCSISNVTLGVVITSNNYYLLSTSSIMSETQLRFSNIHILNASSTFDLLQIRNTATIGSNAIICDNISVAGPSPIRDLEDLFPTVVHPIYSNYSYIDLAQQLQITNYSSNAAVKFDNGKAYIYNSSTGNWMQIQLVTATA